MAIKEIELKFRVTYDDERSTAGDIVYIMNNQMHDVFSGDPWVILEDWGIQELHDIQLNRIF